MIVIDPADCGRWRWTLVDVLLNPRDIAAWPLEPDSLVVKEPSNYVQTSPLEPQPWVRKPDLLDSLVIFCVP